MPYKNWKINCQAYQAFSLIRSVQTPKNHLANLVSLEISLAFHKSNPKKQCKFYYTID